MPRKELVLSGYKGMWLFALFDLPVTTAKKRKKYVKFRNRLLDEGFSMIQYSVYARYCNSQENKDALRRRITHEIPQEGHVRLLSITDRQFGKMEVFSGKKEENVEEPPPQLMLF